MVQWIHQNIANEKFLGINFNIPSYALLTHLNAKESSLEVGKFVHTIGDAYIYLNHIEQVKEQLSRDVRDLLTLTINADAKSIFDIELEDLVIDGYDPHPSIKAPIAM